MEDLQLIFEGVDAWNKWRKKDRGIVPDLSGADLSGTDLSFAHLSRANLSNANLSNANLSGSDLSGASLSNAKLSRANLTRARLLGTELSEARLLNTDLSGADLLGARLSFANLSGANLSNTRLSGSDLSRAILSNANLSGSDLSGADLSGADLLNTDLSGANLSNVIFKNCAIERTSFSNVDLSETKGLENIEHFGPSTIGIDTLYLSKGKIPEVFLRGCGVPEEFISYIPSLLGAQQSIQFYSCFISYSTQDEEFAKRLHSRMRDEKLRVWFAPEDIKGGEKLVEQIENAIQVHDRLLLVLSESSIKSRWVINEIRRARKTEEKQGRRKLFPIRLVDYKTIGEWEHIVSTGEDIAEEIRSYFIPDFSNWKEHDAFEKAFSRLLKDLRAEEKNNL